MTEPKPPVKVELLPCPCPFCGSRPSKGMTVKRGCQMHGDPMQYVTLSCSNNNCPAKPTVKGSVCRYGGSDKPDYHKEATESAIKVWNTRSGTYIPADDFGRILDEMSYALYSCEMSEDAVVSIKAAIALARKYGSAE